MKKPELLIAFASLLLIGSGLSWVYPPAGLVGVGLLLWIDLFATGWRRARREGGG
jgi:hypothetical protein